MFEDDQNLFRTKRLRPGARSAAKFREGSATMPAFCPFLATGAFSVTWLAWFSLLHHAEEVSTQRKKRELLPNAAPPQMAHPIERAHIAQPLQPGTSLPRPAANPPIPCVSSPASGSSSKECDLATFLCHLCQTWFHFQFGLPWRTPFVTMLVPDPTSLDDEDIARAVTMRREELTLAHHVFVDEVLRSSGVCHGAVKIACVCQFTETVSVMERELLAPHVILFRVSFRSWLRQPLCQSSVEWRHFSVVYSSGPCERMLPSNVWAQLADVT